MKEETVNRRRALELLGVLGAVAAGCGGSQDTGTGGAAGSGTTTGPSGSTSSTSTSSTTSASGSCDEIPDETSGPYPDTKDMIDSATYDRSDITEDRTGTPLTLTLTVEDASNSCAPIAGAKVMIWHCDKDGIYSEYSNSTNAGSTSTTYLRGWQVTDANGTVTFKTIYPGWYTPRATHIHIEIYSGSTVKKVTQIGFPDDVNQTVYAQTSLYTKGQNSTTDDSDQVYGNGTQNGTDGGGHEFQIATVTGDTTSGYTASIPVAIKGYS
jgi:protocatechuate 3,4-dioxygenase beta subunit